MYSVHEKCFVNVNLLFILWPAQQVLGEIYFRINGEQRREYWWWWGVVTPLWSDDASYTFGRVGSESPKTWGQEFGRLGKDRGADQRFPYLILQFLGLHSGILKVPVLTLSVCQSLCSLLHCCRPLWPAAESIENVTFDSPMCVWRLKCAVERRGWGERERIQTSRGQRTSPDEHKKAGTEPHPGRRITG